MSAPPSGDLWPGPPTAGLLRTRNLVGKLIMRARGRVGIRIDGTALFGLLNADCVMVFVESREMDPERVCR